ncbi:MAG: hypothetical protein PUB10_08685 [Clostridiales bacterium]|nr:hypothetical protein [Clostridiales bacterium]
MEKFVEIDRIGTLWIDKILFESFCPILFTCINDSNELFLCVCCQSNQKGKKWLLTKTTPDILVGILKNQVAIREAFLRFPEVQYSIFSKGTELEIKEHVADDWDAEHSIDLPDKDEFMDAEEDEFLEEITYYEGKMIDCGNEFSATSEAYYFDMTECDLIGLSDINMNLFAGMEKSVLKNEESLIMIYESEAHLSQKVSDLIINEMNGMCFDRGIPGDTILCQKLSTQYQDYRVESYKEFDSKSTEAA